MSIFPFFALYFGLVMSTGTKITTNSNQPLQQPLDHLAMGINACPTKHRNEYSSIYIPGN